MTSILELRLTSVKYFSSFCDVEVAISVSFLKNKREKCQVYEGRRCEKWRGQGKRILCRWSQTKRTGGETSPTQRLTLWNGTSSNKDTRPRGTVTAQCRTEIVSMSLEETARTTGDWTPSTSSMWRRFCGLKSMRWACSQKPGTSLFPSSWTFDSSSFSNQFHHFYFSDVVTLQSCGGTGWLSSEEGTVAATSVISSPSTSATRRGRRWKQQEHWWRDGTATAQWCMEITCTCSEERAEGRGRLSTATSLSLISWTSAGGRCKRWEASHLQGEWVWGFVWFELRILYLRD